MRAEAPVAGGARRAPRAGRALFAFDRRLGVDRVAGVDEAGRGAFAGPIVVAAVLFDLRTLSRRSRARLADLDDSKRLSIATRADLARLIMGEAEQVVVQVACSRRIDDSGLHRTNLALLARALERLSPAPDLALVDGFRLGPDGPVHRSIVGGDRTSAAIAAASVVAKTVRDRLMRESAAVAHPAYGFERHVGYGTPDHREILRDLGPSPIHRRSFRTVGDHGDASTSAVS